MSRDYAVARAEVGKPDEKLCDIKGKVWCGYWKESDNSVADEEGLDSGYILKSEPTDFERELDLKYERRRFNDDSKLWLWIKQVGVL